MLPDWKLLDSEQQRNIARGTSSIPEQSVRAGRQQQVNGRFKRPCEVSKFFLCIGSSAHDAITCGSKSTPKAVS